MTKIMAYVEKDTPIHKLCGVTKLLFFLSWSIVSMLTYDTRVLAVMLIISFVIYRISKTDMKQVGAVFKFILFFLCLNVIAIFIMSPYEGTKIYGTKTILCHIAGNYSFTAEQLFYEMNIMLKYFTIIPAVLIFILTTNPSEFAASLNMIGVSYNVGYAIAIALRYVPDVQSDYTKIKHAQEAKGIEMSAKASLGSRIKNITAIIFPLVFSSMDRIDVVSNAMELRGFGKNPKRTWYSARKLQKSDKLVMLFTVLFSVAALVLTYYDGNRFFNPFM